MHEPVVISPTAYAIKPLLEHSKFAGTTFGIEPFQQKYCGNFLFEDISGKQIVRNLSQKLEVMLTQNFSSAMAHPPPQGGRVPSVGFDFLLEEPLHAGGMLGRAAVL